MFKQFLSKPCRVDWPKRKAERNRNGHRWKTDEEERM